MIDWASLGALIEMICNRCGSKCPKRPEGYCFHCLIALELDKAPNYSVTSGVIKEGFPDWQAGDKKEFETLLKTKQQASLFDTRSVD